VATVREYPAALLHFLRPEAGLAERNGQRRRYWQRERNWFRRVRDLIYTMF
jgi:hypothetical protein